MSTAGRHAGAAQPPFNRGAGPPESAADAGPPGSAEARACRATRRHPLPLGGCRRHHLVSASRADRHRGGAPVGPS